MFLNKHHFFLIACVTFSYHALISSPSHTTIPVSFPITAWTLSDDGGSAHITALPSQDNRLAVWKINAQLSVPASISPEQVRYNNQDDVANPLSGATITKIASMPFNNSLLLTTEKEPGVVYSFIAPSAAKSIIYSSERLLDSNYSNNTIIEHIQGTTTSTAFVTLRSLDTNDDQLHSLALVKMKEKTLENNATVFVLGQIDPFLKKEKSSETEQAEQTEERSAEQTTEPDNAEQSQEKQEEPEDIRAISCDKQASFIAINHPLSKNPTITCTHWNPRMRCLYIGMRVQTGEQENAGACALAFAKLDSYDKTIPVPAINGTALPVNDQSRIVAAISPNTSICIHHVNSLYTSTDLDYVIVVGGVGPEDETKNQVYALPQFNPRAVSYYTGMVACNNQPMQFGKNPSGYHYVAIREFTHPAAQADELVTNTSLCAQVGNGPLVNGPISAITCVGDAVFASVSQPKEGYSGGIFSSQALFDEQGRIASWTHWRPVCNINDTVVAFSINYPQGSLLWLTYDDQNMPVFKTHTLTNAFQTRTAASKALSDIFADKGGISTVHFFNTQLPDGTPDQMIITAGKTTIACSRASTFSDERLETILASECNEPILCNQNRVVVINNETLDALRTITCLQAVKTPAGEYLFVGGSKGLAAICGANGSSFYNTQTNMLDTTHCIPCTGNVASVKKIVADGNNLYVLTQKSVMRINLATSDIAQNKWDVQSLAVAQDFQTSVINDMLIGHGSALLATGSGVYYSGSDIDCATAQHGSIKWQQLNLPEMVLPITKLNAYTNTADEQDLFKEGGMVHVIGSYRGKNITHIHRLVVDKDAQNQTRVSLLQEIYQDGNRSNFAGYQTHKEIFVTDGALYLSAPSSLQNPTLECGMEKHEQVSLELEKTDKIHAVVKNSITGQWFIAGSFGLFTY